MDAGREYGVNSPDGQLIINKGNLANLALFLALLAVKRSDFCFTAGHAMFCKGRKGGMRQPTGWAIINQTNNERV